MQNVVDYFRRKIHKVEAELQALIKARRAMEVAIRGSVNEIGKAYLTIKYERDDEKIKALASKVIVLQKLLEEAIVAQRLLDASKRQ